MKPTDRPMERFLLTAEEEESLWQTGELPPGQTWAQIRTGLFMRMGTECCQNGRIRKGGWLDSHAAMARYADLQFDDHGGVTRMIRLVKVQDPLEADCWRLVAADEKDFAREERQDLADLWKRADPKIRAWVNDLKNPGRMKKSDLALSIQKMAAGLGLAKPQLQAIRRRINEIEARDVLARP